MVALCLFAFLAGFVDAIVGGGGLIQLPAFLLFMPQLSLVQTLASNKTASFAGTGLSTFHYLKRVKLNWLQLVPGIVSSIAFQPFPKRIAQAALDRGGDLIDVDPDVDRLIIEMNYAFSLQSDYEKLDGIMQETYGGLRERVLGYVQEARLPDVYCPLFMNYAYYRQDYWGRLKPENAEFAHAVAEQVDPAGFFRNRTGGWKETERRGGRAYESGGNWGRGDERESDKRTRERGAVRGGADGEHEGGKGTGLQDLKRGRATRRALKY